MAFRQSLTVEQALQKAKHYCAWQERCHQEVREKLYSFGLHKRQVEEIISQLIEENYLNEERFAILYAGGKFRMKKWGRIKIQHALAGKQVSSYCIQKALKNIDEKDYLITLQRMTESKWNEFRDEENRFARKSKTFQYLLQKGFEQELIHHEIERLMADESTG